MGRISNHHQAQCEFVEQRWRDYAAEPPRSREVFVGRKNREIYPRLFVRHGTWRRDRDTVTYLDDAGTVIGNPYDFFTHWLPVAEVANMPDNEDKE